MIHRTLWWRVVVLTLALGFVRAHAETQTAQRIKSLRQLIPPQKITIGPDDQFQAAVDPSGKYLVFTHKSDLVAHLRLQVLATGQTIELMPLEADSQDASFAPNGQLAFTYYKFNARGDICYADGVSEHMSPLTDAQVHCLKRPANELSSERSSPFWRSSDEVGYVVRDITNQNTRIVIENIKTHLIQTLIEGKAWAPTMQPGGRYLAFTELSPNGERDLALFDLLARKTYHVHLDLPGLSGFSALSEDERFLYFSHFLNDNLGDHEVAIDGAETAVVFRLSVDQIVHNGTATPMIPEQLTSVESSCSFPRPFHDLLFLTCAFENALDIYQVPSTGIVPADWDGATLANALRTSRSHQERILILNTLRVRQKAELVRWNKGLFSNYLLADDISAARHHLAWIHDHSQAPTERDESAALDVFLMARQAEKIQPVGEITRAFRAQIEQLKNKLKRLPGAETLRGMIRAHLDLMLEDDHAAELELRNAPIQRTSTPLVQHLRADLIHQLATNSTPENLTRLIQLNLAMMTSANLSEETRLFYAFQLLEITKKQETTPLARKQALVKLDHGLPADVRALVDAEISELELISTSDDKAKSAAFAKLDGLMGRAQGDYFLRKAMNVRAVMNYAEAAEFRFLSAVAANWLRDTKTTDTEFTYSREVVTTSAIDQAYGYWAKHDLRSAAGFFYQGLSLVDDLESHAGYLRTMVDSGQRSTVDVRYQYLQSHHFIDDNMKFIQALLVLMDEPTGAKNTSALDQAVHLLQAMDLDRNSGVRHLLLGYCQMEKMRRTALGVEFDSELFQQAHRSLMLAYDQGFGNDRVRAAALINLGMLHQQANNFGMSAKFLSLRKKLPFTSPEERVRFAWIYARALFHTYQLDLAARELADLPESSRTIPVRERLAFYNAMSGQYKMASDQYQDLLKSGAIADPLNQAKVSLSYGFVLIKQKREAEARAALSRALALTQKLPRINKDSDPTRVLDFEPIRLQIIATGLLGQIGTPEQRHQSLKARQELLLKAKDLLDNQSQLLIQTQLQMAAAIAHIHPDQAAQDLRQALTWAQAFGEKNGYLSQPVLRTANNFLVHGWQHPETRKDGDTRAIEALTQATIKSIAAQKPVTAELKADSVKLQLLWEAYQQPPTTQGKTQLRTMNGQEATSLKAEAPESHRELARLAQALERRGGPP